MDEFELIAKTFQGLETVLADELTELGAENVQVGQRMVSFTGTKELMYRANFCLRTAVRILKPIKHFTAQDADEVYDAVKTVEWADYLDLGTTFAVDAVVSSEEFRHSKFVAYKVKDAIVDYFREREEGKRPNISVTQPDIRLNIHIAGNECTLSLDSSGESLHLRGYRVATCDAPINEVLAAGLLKLAGWPADCDLIDPFCGSGTIVVEAALMARNIYPGIFRKEFGFERWKDFDADMLDRIYNDDTAEREFNHKIYAYDINIPTLEGARSNAKAAGVGDAIEFQQRDFRDFTRPEAKALLVTNPPYGQRLTPPDLLELYRAIGERLKHEFKGNDAWVISSKEECFDSIGLRPSLKIQLFNGNLDCEFRKYQLFEGKMDAFRAAGGEIKSDDERRKMDERKRSRSVRDTFRRQHIGSDGDEGMDEDERQYAILRTKHREFERNLQYKERAEEARLRREARGARTEGRRFGGNSAGSKGRRAAWEERPRRFGDKPRRFEDGDRRFNGGFRRFDGDNSRRFDGGKGRPTGKGFGGRRPDKRQ
ncbi:MAG: RNA methyltransferase [Alloprevotella sp.]|nr:RNA methyltransferase [Alloprevotella sp.]